MEPKRGSDGKYHIVYKTTVKETGKFYIGKHSTRVLEDGYFGSGKLIGRFIKKYGVNGLSREILAFCESVEVALLKEKEIIGNLYRLDENCMNLKAGGDGGWPESCYGFHSEEHMMKCSKTGADSLAKKLEDTSFRSEFSKAISSGLAASEKWTLARIESQQRITERARSLESVEKR